MFLKKNGYLRIAVPLSLPGMATIGLFSAIAFWNEWFNALLFISSPTKVPLQYLLIRVQNQLDFLINNNRFLSAADSIEALHSMPHESARMAMAVLMANCLLISLYPR